MLHPISYPRNTLVFAAVFACLTSFGVNLQADEFTNVLGSFGNLSTAAGRGFQDNDNSGWQLAMEGGLAINAELTRPHMTMADSDGNLYIADKDANGIRKVTTDGVITTIAGTNVPGFNGDGVGVDSQLSFPNGLYTFADGTTFILDFGNARIRRLATDGQLTTVVSDPDGIAAGRGLWVSADESTIYYTSGTRIRKWTTDEGIETLADGFTNLGNIDVDPLNGTLVASDRFGHRVHRVFADGTTVTIAGNGNTFGGGSGQLATSVGLNEVRGVSFDTTGGFYVATHRDSDVWYVDTAGTIHMLVPGNRSDSTLAGDGQPLTTAGDKISEPRSVALAPNRDLLITENDRGFVRHVPRVTAVGDFDYDGVLTSLDLNLLTQVTQAQTHPMIFNLNDTESRWVDNEDRKIWVEDIIGTRMGDANLDGLVDQSDFAMWNANRFQSGTTWATGDFNGDGMTDVSDYNLWNLNRGFAASVTVPEPAAAPNLAIGALLATGLTRRRRRGDLQWKLE